MNYPILKGLFPAAKFAAWLKSINLNEILITYMPK